MTEIDVRVAEGPGQLAEVARSVVLTALSEALAERGAARWVLAGGSTPRSLYRRLGEADAQALDWSRVSFFWGDERAVPPEDAGSNYRSAREAMLDPLGIEPAQRLRIAGEDAAERAAAVYDALVGRTLAAGAWDLVLLGLGSDGHTASLFPPRGSADQGTAWVRPTRAPGVEPARVSMTLRALNRARRVVFLVSGGAKAEAVGRVLSGAPDLHASAVRPPSGGVTWCLDRAAAAEVPVGSLQSVRRL